MLTASNINFGVFWDMTIRRKLLLVFSALNYVVWVFSDAGNTCPYFNGVCHGTAVTGSISDGSEKLGMGTGKAELQEISHHCQYTTCC